MNNSNTTMAIYERIGNSKNFYLIDIFEPVNLDSLLNRLIGYGYNINNLYTDKLTSLNNIESNNAVTLDINNIEYLGVN
jgi:hypothetical protein